MKEHYWISSREKRLSVMLHTPETPVNGPFIVMCHGFTGDKVGANQFLLGLANAIEAAGFYVVRFDFAGSGESEGDFASDTTVSGWKEDLRNVIGWVVQLPELNRRSVCLLGHSLGGYVIFQPNLTELSVVGRIALAPVVNPVDNFREIIFGSMLWEKAMSGHRISNFYGKGFSLDSAFVLDLMTQPNISNGPWLKSPSLIIHGTVDTAVPITGSQMLKRLSAGNIELEMIRDSDHVFTGKKKKVEELVVDWLTASF